MATPKKSSLDELADKVSVEARPSAGAPVLESEEAANIARRDAQIEAMMRVKQVPRAVAVVMVDKGYSKGTAHRIVNDEFKRATRAREEAHAAAQKAS
jgi:hypothetical protein